MGNTRGMKRGLTKKEKKDIKVLGQFVEIYCRFHHESERTRFTSKTPRLEGLFEESLELCTECMRLLRYALGMRLCCPHDPKPMCKKCPDPCYKPEYREKIREVMKFSGMHLVKRGRFDLLYHYFR